MNLLDLPHINSQLLPLTWTRPIGSLRIGILTLQEKWCHHLHTDLGYLAADYLKVKYPQNNSPVTINSAIIPTPLLAHYILNLNPDQKLMHHNTWIASGSPQAHQVVLYTDTVQHLEAPWQIFTWNEQEIAHDFHLLTKDKYSQDIPPLCNAYHTDRIYIHPTAKVYSSSLNPLDGYIYIGPNAEIMEGTLIRGSVAICQDAQTKMGAKIYGATTIGPGCKAGGELNNVIMYAHSNKAHDGFIGNAVIGEWCNIGADSNNSNLKNNYASVKLWDYYSSKYKDTGLQFCGLIMGDHTKCSINTMFNTGTVLGVSCNIFGTGFPRNFIPDFSWGGASCYTTYRLEDAIATAERVFKRRNLLFDDNEKDIFKNIFQKTLENRKY